MRGKKDTRSENTTKKAVTKQPRGDTQRCFDPAEINTQKWKSWKFAHSFEFIIYENEEMGGSWWILKEEEEEGRKRRRKTEK